MIDKKARSQAAIALRKFLACEIKNDDYESEYPLPELFEKKWSEDRAIRAVYEFSSRWSDNLYRHCLDGDYALNDEAKEIASRCLLFLRSDVEYEWNQERFIESDGLGPDLVTLGLTNHAPAMHVRLTARLDQPEGEASVWPFFRQSDYAAAQLVPHNASNLNGA